MLQLSDSMKNCRPPDNADREPTTKIAPAIPTGIPAFLTATQICDGIHHRYDRIHALEIEYDYTSRTFVEDERHVPFAEYHFAFSGPNRFKAQSIVTTDGRYVYPHHFWAWMCSYSKISTSIPKMHTSRLKKTNGSNTTFIYLRPACPLNHSNRNGGA